MKIPFCYISAVLTPTFLVFASGCSDQRSDPTPTSVTEVTLDETEALHVRGSMLFSDAQIFIEYNSSADDAGIQVFLDAEAWKRVAIQNDRGRKLLEIETGGGMRKLGLTELRFEGAEPEPSQVLDAFPPGEYRFRGATVDRQRLVGSAVLSHDIPDAPVFTPSQGELVDRDNTVIQWDPVAGVDWYQVIVESDDLGFSLTVDLPASVTSLEVPPTFLAPDTEYKAEVLAISPNGNRTITEGTFVTGP